MVTQGNFGLYGGYIGIMGNNMETAIMGVRIIDSLAKSPNLILVIWARTLLLIWPLPRRGSEPGGGFCSRALWLAVMACLALGDLRDPSIQRIPALGPQVCKHYLHWAIWISRERVECHDTTGFGLASFACIVGFRIQS